MGGDGLHIDFDGYRNIVLVPSEPPPTVYAENPELTYGCGPATLRRGLGHHESHPIPCDQAPFIDKALSFVDKIPGLGEPFKEIARFVVYSLFQVGRQHRRHARAYELWNLACSLHDGSDKTRSKEHEEMENSQRAVLTGIFVGQRLGRGRFRRVESAGCEYLPRRWRPLRRCSCRGDLRGLCGGVGPS